MFHSLENYLGDGVYADYDGFHVVIFTTTDMKRVDDEIYLEDTVASALIRYIQDTFKFVTEEE